MSSGQSSSTSLDDSRKRKLENTDDEDGAKVKIAKPSLGLSLLQSYDAEDDYMTSDEEPTSPPSKVGVDSSVTRNVFIEEMTDEDQADENLTDHISSVNSEVADGISPSLRDTNNSSAVASESSVPTDSNIEDNVAPALVDAEKSVDEPNENLMDIQVPSATEVHVSAEPSSDVKEILDPNSSDAQAETQAVSAEKDYEFEVNKQTDDAFSSETSDSKNVDSCQTSVTNETESKPDLRPDYNFSVFGTSSENGSPDERVSGKPAKKVKLNRSKFVRSVDECSNEAKSNAVTSSPVLSSSSDSDSKPMMHANSVPAKLAVEASEKIRIIDQRTEVIKPVEIIERTPDKEDSADLNLAIIPITDENISVETCDTSQSVTDSSDEAVTNLGQLISESPVRENIEESDSTEKNTLLVEDAVADNVENVSQSIEQIAEPKSVTKIDSPFESESVLVDEEIVGPTDILQRDENDEISHDNMIEVIDQDLNVYAIEHEKHPVSEDSAVEELRNENADTNFAEEVKVLELDAAEEVKNDEAPENAAEHLIEELIDENSITQESTTESMFVEELENENTVVEEVTNSDETVEESTNENSFADESRDENLLVEESKSENFLTEEPTENPTSDVDDSMNEKTDVSPLSVDTHQEYSFEIDQSLAEDDEKEPVPSSVEVKDASEPPHRPLKIIIRKQEEKLVVVEDVSRSKRRGRKKKDKSKMKGEENRNKIVEADEKIDSKMSIEFVQTVGETSEEIKDEFEVVHVPEEAEVSEVAVEPAIKKTDDTEMREEAVAPPISETDPTAFKSAQITGEPDVAAESDDETFKDAMDTLEPVSAKMNLEKEAGVSAKSSEPEQPSSLISEATVEPTASAAPTESFPGKNFIDQKPMKDDQREPVEISSSDEIRKPMEVDLEEASAETVSEVPSKLELALTRRLGSDKKAESAALATSPSQEVPEIDKSEAAPKETPPVKENLKLHLSVQGNRVSIKKNVAAEAVVAPLPETAPIPSPVADSEVPPARVKRTYRKRAKPTIDPALLTEEKSYTLRTRNTKNPPAEDLTPKKTKGRKSAAVIAAESASTVTVPEQKTLPVASPLPKKEKVVREVPLPVTVEIDPPPDQKVTTAAGKVRPIRLKIKNPGVTIECTSKYSPVTIEKIRGTEKTTMSENVADIFEEARKKEAQASITQEQAAWSGTDLQRVERLLKESNITITPVGSASSSLSAEPVPQSPSSILKPILTAAKEKSARKSSHKAPSVPPSSSSTIGAASITPIFGDSKDTSTDSSVARNLNVLLKPLDFEEQLNHWKISKPVQEMDVTRISVPAARQQKQQPVDVKMEIRKKIASSERRRQIQEPEVVITVDEATSNLEEISQSTRRVENVPESKPPVKLIRRKYRSKPAEITVVKPTTEVTNEIKTSAEEMAFRLPPRTESSDEFIIPDATPPVIEVTDTTAPIAESAVQECTPQVEIALEPKSEAQSTPEPTLEAQVSSDPVIKDSAALEPEAEIQVVFESKNEVQVVEAPPVSEPKVEAQVTTLPQRGVSEVAVKPEIEVLDHQTCPKTDDAAVEVTSKAENVEPAAESKAEIPLPVSTHVPAETFSDVKPETPISAAPTSATNVSQPKKPEMTVPQQPTLEVKQLTPEPKPKTGKQMPDLLPISKPPMILKSIQISPITSQLAHISKLSQSQLASIAPQATPGSPQDTNLQSAVAPQTTPASQFTPITSQIKLSMTPLTPKILQEALAAPQFTPSQQVSSSTQFMGSPIGTPMSAASMTPSCTPQMADSSINASSRAFAGSATPSYSNLPPLVFPKKRGRPTKAMVAAREAYRQSQGVVEGVKSEQTPTTADSQSMPPSDESSMSNMSVDLLKLSIKRGRKIKSEKSDQTDGSDDNALAEKSPMDPEREMEELKRQEEDRIRKEQERERKNEIRRQKAKERSDLEKAKKLRQRQKAEERHKKVQEQRRLLQEQKKKLEEEIKKLPGFEAGRVTSADVSQMSNSSFLIDDDSNSMSFDPMQRLKKTKMEVYDPDGNNLTVDQIAEYQWPIQGGELYMIQEQISNFLGVKSFKRKYPDIKRRPVDSEERAYLVDSGLVSETLCDLGITAVCSAEVLDIMCSDFPEKYEELRKHMREKQMKELSFKQKAWANGLGYKLLMADGSKQDLKKRAMESVSNWNSALNKSRHEDRRSAIDLQTFIIHYPKSKTQNMTTSSPKIGSYPISILPGQFCDFYKEYTSTELRYLPLNTVIYGPVRHPSAAKDVDGSQTDSDDSSSSDESSTTSEGTQATEDTLEDMDKDMSLDESSLAEKLPDGNTSVREDREDRRETANGVAEASSQVDGKILCKVCLGDENRNKENASEVLIYCSQCSSSSHPTCLDLSLNMVPHIKSYKWQCPDCKNCARCKEYADEDKMLFCDICDRGYHIYCVGLKKVPSGSWQCHECTAVDDQVNRENSMLAPNLPASIPIKIEG